MNPLGRLVLGATHNPVSRRLVTGTAAGRRLAGRFVAGDTLDDAVAAIRPLNESGATVSLDHLGEEVADPALARAACADYLAALERIAADGLDANVSVKLTQLGLGLDDALVAAALDELAAAAAAAGTTVTIDMESSEFTAPTLDLYAEAQGRHGNLGIALQAYLHRTPADLEQVLPLGGHVRLCKGAYNEPSAIAFRERRRVDAAFDVLMRRLMQDGGPRPAIATHDDARLTLARALAATREEPWEVQMLYGVRTDLQAELLAAGIPVRVYLPYGSAWYPYLTRRIAERPANLRFFLRAAVGR